MIKRFLLLPTIIILSFYLIVLGLITTGFLPQDLNLAAWSQSQTQLLKLKKTYKTLHLKRLILEEQHAILLATIKINTLLSNHREINWPKLTAKTTQVTEPLVPKISSQSSPKLKTDKTLEAQAPHAPSSLTKHPSNEPSMTKQEQQSYKDLQEFIQGHHKDPQKLSLSSKEKKSYEELSHFIEEKKLSQQTQLSTDEKWLLATPGKLFTIQIFGAKDEATAQAFVKQHQIKHSHLFHTYYLNKPWVAVVVGKYANYNEALKNLSAYPHGDQPPWIRPISSIHSAIKLYR